MTDELKISSPSALEPEVPIQTVQQTGEKNIYAQSVNKLYVQVQTNISPKILQPSKIAPVNVDTTHYNLFVTYGVDFTQNTAFILELGRSLTEYMDDALKKEFSELSDAAVARIKTFPSIFANENTSYGHTDEEQLLGFGFIRQIKVRHDGVKIYPDVHFLLPQQRLNEALFELGIYGSESFNEFNRTHWSIKKIDLVSELRELGFSV